MDVKRILPFTRVRDNLALTVLGLTLSLVTSAGAAAPAAESKPAGELPPAKDVIAKFVKAIGGKAAFEKIESQHMKGKIDMGAQGITGDLEVFAKRPDKLLIKITLPPLGELSQGYDGKVGWSVNPATGPMVLEGKMLEQSQEQARFDALIHSEEEYKSMETVGKTEFEGKECYQLKLVRKSGQQVTEYYDTQTGLVVGSSEVQETPLGPIAVTGLASDYKPFGDLLFATKLTQKMGPLAQVMTFNSMEFNKVEDSAFVLPEQIKALIKK